MISPTDNPTATGLRMTRQREVILQSVQGFCGHPTAEDVYRVVRKTLPNVSLATVYRNLELLVGKGVIGSVHMAGGQKRFDPRTDSHYHVRCEVCGALDDVKMPRLKRLRPKLDPSDFEITGHRLEFTGICSRCRQKIH